MTPKESIFRALSHQEGPIPWVEVRIDNDIAGRAIGKTVNCVGDVADWIEVANKLGLSCANVRVINRFGTTERKVEGGDVPEVVPLLKDWADLEKVGRPLPDESAVRAQIRRATDNPGAKGLAIIGVTLGVVDPTALSMGFETFFVKTHEEPKFVEAVLDLYADYNGAIIEILSSVPGIDLIWIADDMAYDTGPYLGPRLFRELILPRYQKLTAKMKKPWLFHSDGNLRPILSDLLALGLSVLHPIQPGAMDIFELKKEIGDRVCLAGNVNLETLATGTPQQVREEVLQLAQVCGKGGGYLISSSNSIPDWAKVENVLAMAEAIREANRSRP